jgi:hypothetical protein
MFDHTCPARRNGTFFVGIARRHVVAPVPAFTNLKDQKSRDKIALAGLRRWDRVAASGRLHRMAA